MASNSGGQPNPFDLHLLLVFALLGRGLFQMVAILIVAQNLDYWGVGFGGNLNQIKALGPREIKGFCRWHDAKHLALGINDPNFYRLDAIIGSNVLDNRVGLTLNLKDDTKKTNEGQGPALPRFMRPDEFHHFPVFAQILVKNYVLFVDDHLVVGSMQFGPKLHQIEWGITFLTRLLNRPRP